MSARKPVLDVSAGKLVLEYRVTSVVSICVRGLASLDPVTGSCEWESNGKEV